MEYLLFLQGLRQASGDAVNETILFLSEVMGGAGGLAVMALVYWCLSKRAGIWMLLSFSGAYLTNQTLKNIFCVSRPFVRDPRIVPYTSASGYSFPSGHTMLGTAIYTTAAVWQRKRRWFAALCVLLTLLTAFGRNWIGVHTLQDVAAGMAVSLAVVAVQGALLSWLEKKPKGDLALLGLGWLWALAVLALLPNSGKVCGIFLGTVTGWFIERRRIGFSVEGSRLCRILRYGIGMAVVLTVNKVLLPPLLAQLGDTLQPLLLHFFTFLLVTAGWPAVICLLRRLRRPAKEDGGYAAG